MLQFILPIANFGTDLTSRSAFWKVLKKKCRGSFNVCVSNAPLVNPLGNFIMGLDSHEELIPQTFTFLTFKVFLNFVTFL